MEANRLSDLRGKVYARAGTVSPTSLILLSILSVQVGAALAKHLFSSLGPAGTVFLRTAFAALVLFLAWRPQIRGHTRKQYLAALAFGVTIALMNLTFYASLARLPIGIAVTLEFVGPLGVAVLGSRRWLDVCWAVLAALGVILLSPITDTAVDALGVVFALIAGGFWAAYILLNGRVSQAFPGGTGLTLSMGIASLIALPFGVLSAGQALLDVRLLALGFAVALLSSAIPFSLEFEALRRVPPRVFGILASLEPAVAVLAGVILLNEILGLRELVAIALVVTAAAGASRYQKRPVVVELPDPGADRP